MQCEYCSKVYNRNSNLKYHQKNDKACLKLQEKPIPNHNCLYCEKTYTAKTLQRHMLMCNSKNEYHMKQAISILTSQLKQKEQEVEKLRQDLKDQALKIYCIPGNLLTDIHDESIVMKVSERFRDEFLSEHQRGIVKYSRINMCNSSKDAFTRSEEIEMEMKLNDDKMSSLTKHLADDIIKKSIPLYNENISILERMSDTPSPPNEVVVYEIEGSSDDDNDDEDEDKIVYLYDTFDLSKTPFNSVITTAIVESSRVFPLLKSNDSEVL